jgi:hypothetical protein
VCSVISSDFYPIYQSRANFYCTRDVWKLPNPTRAANQCLAVKVLVFLRKNLFYTHSFCSLSYDRSVVSSKASSPQGTTKQLKDQPILVAAWCNAWVCGRSLARIAGSNPAGGMDVCILWVLCVLSGRGLCDRPITCPEESYRMWCVWVWSRNFNDEEA